MVDRKHTQMPQNLFADLSAQAKAKSLGFQWKKASLGVSSPWSSSSEL